MGISTDAAPNDPEINATQKKTVRWLPLFLFVICLSPCLLCSAARIVPYAIARIQWSSHGSNDYNITLIQGGLVLFNPYLMPGSETLLVIREGKIIAVFVDGRPFDKIAPHEFGDSTVEGLFNTAWRDVLFPFTDVTYDAYYGYPRAINGHFFESGGVAVIKFQLGTATPTFLLTPTPSLTPTSR